MYMYNKLYETLCIQTLKNARLNNLKKHEMEPFLSKL